MDGQKTDRSAGVLLPITMLPGPFGIGVLGKEAREFVDFLCGGGFSLWQILPAEHTGTSFSPYKCVSAFAGEPMLIDPRWLHERGLVTEYELEARCEGMNAYAVDYERVHDSQMVLLRTAFSRLSGRAKEECDRFNPFWLDEYAIYMALREENGMQPWYHWRDDALRLNDPRIVERAYRENRGLAAFYRFVQWVFDAQWRELRAYANSRGVNLVGDIPFYVSEDSAEVWSRREMFAIDDNGGFLAVAGAPPDYFNSDGQRWGNPIYDWEYMKRDGYRWWTVRMRAALERCDMVRVDHFRGFESYWRIPADSESARDGEWVKGPGAELFETMERELGSLPIIAEDLGDVGPEVEELLRETGYPGMRVLQFGFMGDDSHLPHNLDENTAAYTGTHDNTTLLAWMYELRAQDRDAALFYSGFTEDWTRGGPNCGICLAWIRLLYLSRARYVVVPIQDMLGYGEDTRTNIPGTPEGNWRFRVTQEALAQIDTGFYRRLATLSGRAEAI